MGAARSHILVLAQRLVQAHHPVRRCVVAKAVTDAHEVIHILLLFLRDAVIENHAFKDPPFDNCFLVALFECLKQILAWHHVLRFSSYSIARQEPVEHFLTLIPFDLLLASDGILSIFVHGNLCCDSSWAMHLCERGQERERQRGSVVSV